MRERTVAGLLVELESVTLNHVSLFLEEGTIPNDSQPIDLQGFGPATLFLAK